MHNKFKSYLTSWEYVSVVKRVAFISTLLLTSFAAVRIVEKINRCKLIVDIKAIFSTLPHFTFYGCLCNLDSYQGQLVPSKHTR